MHQHTLIEKLFALNISPQLVCMMGSFLSDRQIYAKVNGISSALPRVHASVPQGVVLSPTLLNVMTNGLQLDNYHVIKYADDVTVVKSAWDDDDLYHVLHAIATWADNNYLSINPSKTQIMEVCNTSASLCTHKLGAQELQTVDHIKLLSATIEDWFPGLELSHCKCCFKMQSTLLHHALTKVGGLVYWRLVAFLPGQ